MGGNREDHGSVRLSDGLIWRLGVTSTGRSEFYERDKKFVWRLESKWKKVNQPDLRVPGWMLARPPHLLLEEYETGPGKLKPSSDNLSDYELPEPMASKHFAELSRDADDTRDLRVERVTILISRPQADPNSLYVTWRFYRKKNSEGEKFTLQLKVDSKIDVPKEVLIELGQ